MRLLQYNNDGEFSLTKDLFGVDIPDYAILSHTWGADTEEVTYRDIIDGTGKNKIGYKKIRFCGEQARRDRLEYFWVDTCCINKANYAELQHHAEFNPQSWDSEFWKSRWFTRGWTLQELLAPRSVEFFSRECVRLGDKNELKHSIQGITSIPILALQGAHLSQFTVDERFSWMERRQTTLEVDRVYSLLGILDVKIPLIKDTEAATAFRRLREVIDKRERCVQDLRLTDPRHDKKRIEDTKGGLLEDSYRWILENSDFQRWRDDQDSRLLWIKGDPGKGKTMLLCGIINELEKSMSKTAILSYFFCQTTDSRINNATAVLRGLLYLLLNQQPSLISHVQKKHDHAGKALFEDANAWTALCEIFANILRDPNLNNTYLIIDALDECETDLPQLLNLIVRTASISPRVKWIVSSRNQPDIESRLRLDDVQMRLSLELNEEHVSRAVEMFINLKVSKLALITHDSALQETVRGQICAKASGTFLWAALVLKELEPVDSWDVLDVLQDMPPELEPLYDRMLRQVEQLQRKAPEFCRLVLSTIILAYRPLHLLEVGALSDLPKQISTNVDSVMRVVNQCGSFLAVRENRAYFIHQSAKDFLLEKAFDRVFPSGKAKVNYTMFSRSQEVMSKTLRRDIYGLYAPGLLTEKVKPPLPDPLAAAQYSCLYWVDHLLDCDRGRTTNDLEDGGTVYQVFRTNYLYWLEALSLMKSLPDGIVVIMKLENWLQANTSPDLRAFIHDAGRFAVYNRSVIEQAPLQLYCSALIFAPEKSIIRETFENHIPPWIQRKPRVQAHWSAALQTLEGHSSVVMSVAFSPDGKQVVSGSDDETVRLWDAATGTALQTLEGHSSCVNSVAFSPDGKQVVSGSGDETVRLWDAATGTALQTLEGYSSAVNSEAFSPNGKLLPTLRVSNHWIIEGKVNILWLPPDYRSSCEAIWGEIIVLGHLSGKLSFLQFRQGPKLVV